MPSFSVILPYSAADRPKPMPPSICARMMSGLIATPQSTAHTTWSTRILLSLSTVTSATWATKVSNDSCDGDAAARAARPPCPARAAAPSRPSPRPASSAARWRGCLREQIAPERHRVLAGGDGELVDQRLRRIRGMRGADRAKPQHRHAGRGRMQLHRKVTQWRRAAWRRLPRWSRSMPSLTISDSNAVPTMIDWPTMRWCQPSRCRRRRGRS